MGVDFYPCSRCMDVYCDCGDYVTCNEDAGGCGRDWCSDECAEKDGYIKEYCKLGKNVEYSYCQGECEFSDDNDCSECKNYVKDSCKYCRNEDYEDSELLEAALKMLDISRNDLIEAMKCK